MSKKPGPLLSAGNVQNFSLLCNPLTSVNNGTLTNDGVTQTDPNALFGESIPTWRENVAKAKEVGFSCPADR